MNTEIFRVEGEGAFERALAWLREGQVIAIPTDTVYGVASDGFNPAAIEQLFAVKDRPRDKAIPLLLADADDLLKVGDRLPEQALVLARKFWPGGLTLVVRCREQVPMILRGDGSSVAVRVPNHPVPRNLARSLGRPIAATSANISGGPNPSSAQDVLDQLGGRLGLILDGGTVGEGVPSTVLDVTVFPPRILRAGSLSVEEIQVALGAKLHSGVDRN